MPLPEMIAPYRECGGERSAAETHNSVALSPRAQSLIDMIAHRIELDALVSAECGAGSWYTRKPPRSLGRA